MEYSIGEISHIRIKCRECRTFGWVTLFEIPIADFDDFRFQLYDQYNRAKTEYKYALVSVMNNVGENRKIRLDKTVRLYYGIRHQRTQEILWYPLGFYLFNEQS